MSNTMAMRDALLESIWNEMAQNQMIYFVTADFGSPVLDKIRADYPNRFRNVGIAEQNLINVASGLALEGFTVFAYAIAPFITMRCYEQIRVSLALLSEVREINVNLIGVGAGYSYVVSGPTHQCYEDITLVRSLPGFHLLSPSDSVTSGLLVHKCLSVKKPKYIRLDAQVLPVIYEEKTPNLDKGYDIRINSADAICLIATGYMVHTAIKVAEAFKDAGFFFTVVDLFDIQNFDEKSMVDFLSKYESVVSLEEGFIHRGGLDSRMKEFFMNHDLNPKFLGIGVNPSYHFELGSRDELHELVGVGANAVIYKIKVFLNISENLGKLND